MYSIDKNIPAPILGGAKKYPLDQMVVGDSFFVPDDTARNRLSVATYRHATAHPGRKYSLRKCEGGYRVWRVA